MPHLKINSSPSSKRPDRLSTPPSLSFNGYRDPIPSPEGSVPAVDHSHSSSAKVKNG